jgi:hypothetical protein
MHSAIPFVILFIVIGIIGVASYYRFMINHDYLVSYEGVCNPAVEECFVGCEDEECAQEYFYSEVQKYAADLYMQCGKDITDCESASVCFQGDRECYVTYCSVEMGDDNCETFTEEWDIQGDTTPESDGNIEV